MGIVLPPKFRTAEKVSLPSLNFTSLSFSSFWSGQFIVPERLSPSFWIVSSDVRCWSPILYSHFQVPTGSAFSPCANAKPQSPSTNATERIVFMFASGKLRFIGASPFELCSEEPDGGKVLPPELDGHESSACYFNYRVNSRK